MRRLMTVLVLFGILAGTARSGDLVEVGIKVGANVTNPRGLADGISSTSDLTYLAGAYVQVGFFDLLAVGAELVYEGRNFTLITNVPDGSQQSTLFDASTLNIPLFVRIGLPLGLSAELGVEYAHFLGDTPGVPEDGQGLALLGLSWHPIQPIRIGARFKPSLSALSINGIDDLGLNVTHFYVAWVII